MQELALVAIIVCFLTFISILTVGSLLYVFSIIHCKNEQKTFEFRESKTVHEPRNITIGSNNRTVVNNNPAPKQLTTTRLPSQRLAVVIRNRPTGHQRVIACPNQMMVRKCVPHFQKLEKPIAAFEKPIVEAEKLIHPIRNIPEPDKSAVEIKESNKLAPEIEELLNKISATEMNDNIIQE